MFLMQNILNSYRVSLGTRTICGIDPLKLCANYESHSAQGPYVPRGSVVQTSPTGNTYIEMEHRKNSRLSSWINLKGVDLTVTMTTMSAMCLSARCIIYWI